jgi:hypothetical protein
MGSPPIHTPGENLPKNIKAALALPSVSCFDEEMMKKFCCYLRMLQNTS